MTTTITSATPALSPAAASTQTQTQPPIVTFKGTLAVKVLLSFLVVAALVATQSLSNQQGNTFDQAAATGAGAGAARHSRLRGVRKSNADRDLAGAALSTAAGGGSSNAGAITSYAGFNQASGTANGGGRSNSNSFAEGDTGSAFGTAGGRAINNSTTNAKSADITVADANANSTSSFNSYGVALYYEDGAFSGYYGFGEKPASSKGSGQGSEDSYGGGLAFLGEVGALAQGENLAKGRGEGGGLKPYGYASFGGGGGGGGDQYGGSYAAFGPRFNDSAYGLPELPGALGQLTRPNKTATSDNTTANP
jgi:hypothetical protein